MLLLLLLLLYLNLRFAFLGTFAKWRKETISLSCLYVRPAAWNNSAFIGRILMKPDISDFFENLSRKFKLHENPTTVTGTLHENISAFMTLAVKCFLE